MTAKEFRLKRALAVQQRYNVNKRQLKDYQDAIASGLRVVTPVPPKKYYRRVSRSKLFT